MPATAEIVPRRAARLIPAAQIEPADARPHGRTSAAFGPLSRPLEVPVPRREAAPYAPRLRDCRADPDCGGTRYRPPRSVRRLSTPVAIPAIRESTCQL